MIDIENTILPIDKKSALLISDTEWGIRELEGLLVTLGGKKSGEFFLREGFRINPKTFIGEGKAAELQGQIERDGVEVVVFDFELSPSQQRNLEKTFKIPVLDRSGLILEIFNRHAHTSEAKLAVKVARMEYLMPRLTHLWSHFERQRGSGGGALKGKGMGEKQVEVDRRLVRERIQSLKLKLKDVERVRKVQRKGRTDVVKVAFVGYTNAGKSTLMNAVTGADVYVKDALFATLDATVRLMNPKAKPQILCIDTVGFIDRLPHSLVASFRSTLGEVLEADLIIHVVDGSSEDRERQFQVTREVLEEIGVDLKKINLRLLVNKMDLTNDKRFVKTWAVGLARELDLPVPLLVSAVNAEDVVKVRDEIIEAFGSEMPTYEAVVPFTDGKALAKIYANADVAVSRETTNGVFFRFRALPSFIEKSGIKKYLTG